MSVDCDRPRSPLYTAFDSDSDCEDEDALPRISDVHRQYVKEGRRYLVPGSHSSLSYSVRTGDPSSTKKFLHRIYFKDNFFTLDGKNYRNVDDPCNHSFLEILKQNKCPDEFQKVDGLHVICISRAGDMEGVDLFKKRKRKNYHGPKYDTWDDGEGDKDEVAKDED